MQNHTNPRTFNVSGMSCGHCKAAVETAIRQVANVSEVSVDLQAGKAVIMGNATDAEIVAAIKDAGYEAHTISAPS